ncbi:MAG: PIN domain-containing protein, partial [Actinomycetota bacterium]|nr:PIN domain-containing protein [Actinomycetota bacterium]
MSPTAGSTRKKKAQAPLVRTYVLDTSVLLADPGALRRFAEHEVVLPVVVITELEGKRHHPELGYFARTALRLLDELRVTHGRLDNAVPVGEEGGSIRVELNHTDPGSLPSGFRLGDNDTRILAVAKNLADEGAAVTLVSKDLPLRIKASAVGLDAEEYRGEKISESDPGYSGMAEMDVLASDLDELYDDGVIDLGEARDMPCHQGLVLLSDRGTALARVGAD